MSPSWIRSPTLKAFSARTKKPEIIFDTEVWAAKPMATPAIPAAPTKAFMFIPSFLNIVIKITARQVYWRIFVIRF